VLGCYISNGGKSFLCMHSTFTDKAGGETRSRILPEIPGGAIVTAPRSQIHNLVTEWGAANLAGRSTWERAELVIGIAHPDFRDELIRAAHKRGIWRRSNKIA
jgi:acyl-CoA hydrolase